MKSNPGQIIARDGTAIGFRQRFIVGTDENQGYYNRTGPLANPVRLEATIWMVHSS